MRDHLHIYRMRRDRHKVRRKVSLSQFGLAAPSADLHLFGLWGAGSTQYVGLLVGIPKSTIVYGKMLTALLQKQRRLNWHANSAQSSFPPPPQFPKTGFSTARLCSYPLSRNLHRWYNVSDANHRLFSSSVGVKIPSPKPPTDADVTATDYALPLFYSRLGHIISSADGNILSSSPLTDAAVTVTTNSLVTSSFYTRLVWLRNDVDLTQRTNLQFRRRHIAPPQQQNFHLRSHQILW